jgi:hypothetical protein
MRVEWAELELDKKGGMGREEANEDRPSRSMRSWIGPCQLTVLRRGFRRRLSTLPPQLVPPANLIPRWLV